MPYIPNLIPKEAQVLPGYFKDSKQQQTGSEKQPNWHLVIMLLFLIAAFVQFHYLGIALINIFIALLFTSKGTQWLEKLGTFQMTSRIRYIFAATSLILCLPLYPYYHYEDEVSTRMQQAKKEAAIRYSADSLRKDNIRKDSLAVYLNRINDENPQRELADISNAAKFTLNKAEKDSLTQLRQNASLKLLDELTTSGQYKSALSVVQNLLNESPSKPELLYKRALCYLKIDSTQLAVNDLDTAMNNGYKEAAKLYNKVNPVRRRVAYYETLCNDGSSSDATGRGACSWHGGVAQWNHPVYEEYRKY